MVNLYEAWVESGKATFGTTNGKPTRFLQDTSSIPAYFTAILNNWVKADKEGKKNLKCIKEIDGRWRLFNDVGDEIVSEIMPCKVCD